MAFLKHTRNRTVLTRQTVCSRRRGAGCQGDVCINIRCLLARALTLLGAVKTVCVAATSAVSERTTATWFRVKVPAYEAAATRPYWHRLCTRSCHTYTRWRSFSLSLEKGKRVYNSSQETHLTDTERHLPSEITECYLPSDISKGAPPQPQPMRPAGIRFTLPLKDGRLSWPEWLVGYIPRCFARKHLTEGALKSRDLTTQYQIRSWAKKPIQQRALTALSVRSMKRIVKVYAMFFYITDVLCYFADIFLTKRVFIQC